MTYTAALFISTKYWKNKAELDAAVQAVSCRFEKGCVVPVIDGDLRTLYEKRGCDTLIMVPFSGSVQPVMLEAATQFKNLVLFAGYVEGNFEPSVTNKLLYHNAAPTLLDSYAVLKRDAGKRVLLKRTFGELQQHIRVLKAREQLHGAKILIIGAPEPWVVSVSRTYSDYEENLGVCIETVPQEELMALYEKTPFEDAADIYKLYAQGAAEIIEPSDEDLRNTARLARAMERLLTEKGARGMAIACFDLIMKLAVNPCIGVSYINGQTPYFAACEGDIDSACTMLMLNCLTEECFFMANPCLSKDDSINFVHCTAPITACGKEHPFVLRNHHETGVGAAPDVRYPDGLTVSLFRYSGALHAMSIHIGKSIPSDPVPSCRTQMRVKPDDFDRYLRGLLGCHQVISFADVTEEMRELAALLNIKTV